MCKKLFVLVLAVVFLVTTVLPVFSEPVPILSGNVDIKAPVGTESAGKEDTKDKETLRVVDHKEASGEKELELPSPDFIHETGRTLDDVDTAFAINCAAGNVLACIPSAGITIVRTLGWVFRDREAEKKQLPRQLAIQEITVDSCLNVLGDKEKAELLFKDTTTGKDSKIECVRIINLDKKRFTIRISSYEDNGKKKKLVMGSTYDMVKHNDRVIAKKKCLPVIGKEDQGEVNYKDTETGVDYKFSWTKELIGEDKFPVVKILIAKNGSPSDFFYYPVLQKLVPTLSGEKAKP